jgi:dihydrodipicolinate synthase/N-acetylneuraminate lyase
MAVTPFTPYGELDLDRMVQLARTAADHNYAAFVVAGGAGEISDLQTGEVHELVRAAAAGLGSDSGCLLLVGVHASAANAGFGEDARTAGAGGLLCFADPDPAADADAGLDSIIRENDRNADLVVVIDHDGRRFTLNGLRTISERYPGGTMKYGAPDLRGWNLHRQALPNIEGWVSGAGEDVSPGFAAHGASGFTSTAANIVPDLIAAVSALVGQEKYGHAADLLRERVQPLASLRSSRPNYVPATTKAAMSHIGHGAGEVRDPAARFTVSDTDRLIEALRALLPGEWSHHA